MKDGVQSKYHGGLRKSRTSILVMKAFISTFGLTSDYLLQLDDIGTIKIINPQHASHLLLGMVKGHLHTHALLDSSYRPSEQQISMQVEEAVDIFLNGVLT